MLIAVAVLGGCASPSAGTTAGATREAGPALTTAAMAPPPVEPSPPAETMTADTATTTGPPTTTPPPPVTTATAAPEPAVASPWTVGANPLPLRPDGYGRVLPTPAVLADRKLPTADLLPPPATAEFAATVSAVPAAVLARSTWRRGCPVPVDQLRYLTVSFWGFDGRHHTGELIANSRIATRLVGVFEQLHNARFPIEEMRVVTAAELTAAPTGDGNNTQAFVCREANGHSHWSAHAYGLAVDLNPFCNPYLLGDLVVPELASAYADRRWARPGMVSRGDVAVRAFARIGWSWGGNWRGPRDLMHFTATGL